MALDRNRSRLIDGRIAISSFSRGAVEIIWEDRCYPRFGSVTMVEPDLETLQSADERIGSDLRDRSLGDHPGLIGRDHDGAPWGVVGSRSK